MQLSELKNLAEFEPIDMAFYKRSFVSGYANEDRLGINYFFRKSHQQMIAHVHFGSHTEGPPGFVHGGAMSAVLDEAMGVTAWLCGHPVVTANLSVDYLERLPLGSAILCVCTVQRIDARKVFVAGNIRDEGGSIFSRGSGLFLSLPWEKFEDSESIVRKHYGI